MIEDFEAYTSFIVICVLGVWTVVFGVFSANPPRGPDGSACIAYEIGGKWDITPDNSLVPTEATLVIDVG